MGRYVEHYWSIRWDLRASSSAAAPASRAVLSHPAIHLTIEDGDGPLHGYETPVALVHGVVRSTFRVDLPSSGQVFGVRFRPGGYSAMTGRSVDTLTDRVVALDGAEHLRDDVLAAGDDPARAALLDVWLAERLPDEVAPDYARVLVLIGEMVADRGLQRTEDVAALGGTSVRTLQRLFKRFIGVGPKWLLARYRLHDALAVLDDPGQQPGTGGAVDLAELAASLGWFDQAHFTRDFTAHVGVSPLVYLARPR